MIESHRHQPRVAPYGAVDWQDYALGMGPFVIMGVLAIGALWGVSRLWREAG